MLDETNKLTMAVALMRAAILSERWADAELALLDAERQITTLHRFVAEKHTLALQLRKKGQG